MSERYEGVVVNPTVWLSETSRKRVGGFGEKVKWGLDYVTQIYNIYGVYRVYILSLHYLLGTATYSNMKETHLN